MASAWFPSTESRSTRCLRMAPPPDPEAAKRRRSGRLAHPTGPTTTGPATTESATTGPSTTESATTGRNKSRFAHFMFLSGFNNT